LPRSPQRPNGESTSDSPQALLRRVLSGFSQIIETGKAPNIDESSTFTGDDGITPDGLTPQDVERERAACKASFAYFCSHYAYVTEPRPPDENTDPDEDSDFQAFFKGKRYQASLSAEALALLQKDLDLAAQENGGTSTELPFALWDFQVEAAAWLEWLLVKRKSGAIEKCRDMGMSWLVLWFIIWCWLFRPGFQALIGSRKEASVDNGKLDSLFGKLDYGITKLPTWLQPKGYNRAKNRTYLSIVNPETKGFIAGDSQTEDFGRGGRYTIIFLDEYAFWTQDVWGSVRQASKTVIAGSTVNGKNLFYRLTQRLRKISGSRVLRMEWWKNPTHTEEWFKQQQAENDEATFAREVLIDYEASVKGKYYPICSIIEATGRLKERLKWTPGWPSFLSWDYGVSDNTALIWWQKHPDAARLPVGEPIYRMMFSYTNNARPIGFYVPFARAELPTPEQQALWQYSQAEIDFILMLQKAGVTRFLEHRGDPAGKQRSQDTAVSVEQTLAKAGIVVRSNTKDNSYAARRSALTDVLMRCEVNREGAWAAFDAISQSKYPDRSENSQSTTAPSGPVHDWTSHYRSSAEYFAVGEAKLPRQFHVINAMADDEDDGENGRPDPYADIDISEYFSSDEN
jgi:hypothetical protein